MAEPLAKHTDPFVSAIVLGGSAGAVEALTVILRDLPATFGAALVVVVHVPPRLPSALAFVLAQGCALQVREADDKDPLAPGTVYVAPPGYHLLVERGSSLALSVDGPVAFSQPSIDVLFESAALALGPRLCGVVLSGANDDGAEGLGAIREAGGVALVQRPDVALFSAMPAAALRRCPDAEVLDVKALSRRLCELAGAGRPGAAR
jgi:two-component system chemotaxis response regulator CheB